MPRSTTLTTAAFAALAACALAAPAASQVTTAGGEVVSAAQKHLVDNLITLDSIQAATAKLAAIKTQNAEIKEFANTLSADHAGHAGGLQKDLGQERRRARGRCQQHDGDGVRHPIHDARRDGSGP